MTEHGRARIHDASELSDADLVLRTRSGDADAFGELWRRHHRSGLTVARSVSPGPDSDDLVQEAYARIYRSILQGGGPSGSFRAYLFTTIRNTAAAWGRARRETAFEILDTVEDPATSEQATAGALDRGLTHQAFRSLPTRWQEVLWYSEIEQMKPSEIAPLLGLKPTAVAQLTFRAREGLREAWIQAHLRSAPDADDCQWTIARLGAYARRNVGRRDEAKIQAHLAECARCTIVAAEAHEVGSRLALVLLPLTIGLAGATGYLASLHGAAAPAVALAATSTTIASASAAALTGSTDAPGSLAAAASGGSMTAGSAATTGAATVGGVFSGVSATMTLAAAGVVVVGTVMAAAVALPPLLESTPSRSALSQLSADGALPDVDVDVPPDGARGSTARRQPAADADRPRSPETTPPDPTAVTRHPRLRLPRRSRERRTRPAAVAPTPVPVDPEPVAPSPPVDSEAAPPEPGTESILTRPRRPRARRSGAVGSGCRSARRQPGDPREHVLLHRGHDPAQRRRHVGRPAGRHRPTAGGWGRALHCRRRSHRCGHARPCAPRWSSSSSTRGSRCATPPPKKAGPLWRAAAQPALTGGLHPRAP